MRSNPKISVKPLATTNSRAAKVSPLRSWKVFICALRRFRSRGEIPVQDLFSRHERDVRLLPDLLEDAAEISRAMRRAHDVGMDHERHDAGGIGGIVVDLLELIDGAIVIFRCLVMLD